MKQRLPQGEMRIYHSSNHSGFVNPVKRFLHKLYGIWLTGGLSFRRFLLNITITTPGRAAGAYLLD